MRTEGVFQVKHNGKRPNSNLKDKKKATNDKNVKGKAPEGSSFKDTNRRGKFPLYLACKRTNHLEEDCCFKDKGKIQYRYCKKYGHIENFCRIRQN